MNFWTIYCPVFAAMLSMFGITELFHFSLGYYFHRKQEKWQKELEKKIASGEIDPMQLMARDMSATPGMFDNFPQNVSTVSGSNGKEPQGNHGQYL